MGDSIELSQQDPKHQKYRPGSNRAANRIVASKRQGAKTCSSWEVLQGPCRVSMVQEGCHRLSHRSAASSNQHLLKICPEEDSYMESKLGYQEWKPSSRVLPVGQNQPPKPGLKQPAEKVSRAGKVRQYALVRVEYG